MEDVVVADVLAERTHLADSIISSAITSRSTGQSFIADIMATQWVQQENDCDIDRCPGQIENGVDTRSGDKLTEGIEITQELAASAPEILCALDDCTHDPTGQKPVEADTCTRENARAYSIKPCKGQ